MNETESDEEIDPTLLDFTASDDEDHDEGLGTNGPIVIFAYLC